MHTIIKDIQISSIASYLPENILELSELSPLYGEKNVRNIMDTTGIERIRYASEGVTSSDMCYEAARHLMEQDRIQPENIDGIIFVSQTPDYRLPATSVILQEKLGMNRSSICQDIPYGCSGYVYGIFQAALWIHSNICSQVLVLSGDTSTKMINKQDKSVRMVFGDCGTATLVRKGEFPLGASFLSDGRCYDKLIIPAGGGRLAISDKTKELVFDNDDNGRTAEDLYMDGFAVFGFVASTVHSQINKLIERMSWRKEEVGLFALHQANDFIVNHIRKKLNVPAEIVPINVRNYGNTGPATIPLLLCDLCKSKKYDLSKVLISGFGVGFSLACLATNLEKTTFYQPINGDL